MESGTKFGLNLPGLANGAAVIAVDCDSDILGTIVCASEQAEVDNAKLNKVSAIRNDFILPSLELD